jgi:hypothetical protein
MATIKMTVPMPDAEAAARAVRQTDYMRGVRAKEAASRARRLKRLEQRAAGIREACKAYDHTMSRDGRTTLSTLVIREPFVLCDPPRSLPVLDPEDDGPAPPEDVATRPAMTQLVHRRTDALAFYLTALWEAQTSTEPGAAYEPARPLYDAAEGWDRMFGWRHLDMPKRDKQVRLQRILRELADRDLVGLASPRTPGRYENFTLLTDGRGVKRYRVPKHEATITVPAELVTNGWHLVLTPPKIVVMLMLLAVSQSYPTAHHGPDGVGVAPRIRREVYGVTPEVYEAHNELWEFELIERIDSVPGRRRGRVARPGPGEEPLVTFGFKIKPDVFKKPAYDIVHIALSREGEGRSSDWPRPVSVMPHPTTEARLRALGRPASEPTAPSCDLLNLVGQARLDRIGQADQVAMGLHHQDGAWPGR